MTGTKKTLAMFGGVAALAFALGFGGGVGVDALGNTTTATTHPAPTAAPAPTKAAPGVHFATLTGCIAGLDC